jgi:hypothetical protein
MHPFMGTRAGWTYDRHARRYDYMDIRPPPLTADAGTYNLWEDFEAALYRPKAPVDQDSEGVRALRDFTRGLLGEDSARERWDRPRQRASSTSILQVRRPALYTSKPQNY